MPNDGHVMATIVDGNTLEVDGVVFVRKSKATAKLMPLDNGFAPDLMCTNCNYRTSYFTWYYLTGWGKENRTGATHCQACGAEIVGVVGHASKAAKQ